MTDYITAKVGAYYRHQDGRTVGPVWEILSGHGSLGDDVVVPSDNPAFITETIPEAFLTDEVYVVTVEQVLQQLLEDAKRMRERAGK